MVRLVLFDIDGTLIRTDGAGVRAFARAFETEFKVANGSDGIKFAGRTDSSLLREMLARQGLEVTPDRFRRFFDAYVFWLDHYLDERRGRICTGVPALLTELKAMAPAPLLGLLTGNIRLGAELKLRRFGLWREFSTGAFGDDHEDRNRIAAIAFERGRQALGEDLRPDQVLVVGDTPKDVACGRSIGARVLGVATGGATLADLADSRPDWVVADLGQVKACALCA
jgi:phosphoglycolate phosphatase-like HAD superfamily hydrolase